MKFKERRYPMTCVEVQELLSAYIDKQLSEEQMKEVQEHIQSCSRCKKDVQELENVLAELSSLEDVPVPEAFDKRLHEALVAEGNHIKNRKDNFKEKNKRTKWKRISSVAAVFLVGLFSVILYNSNSDIFNKPDVDYGYRKEAKEELKAEAPVSDESSPTAANDSGEASKQENNKSSNLLNQGRNSYENPSDTGNSENEQSEQPPNMEEKQRALSAEQPSRTYNSIEDESLVLKFKSINVELNSYMEQLDNILEGSEYEVNSCVQNEEENLWTIDVTIITTDSEGKEIRENAVYYGQDGKLWKKE